MSYLVHRSTSSKLNTLSEERNEVEYLTDKINRYENREDTEEEIFSTPLQSRLPEGLRNRIKVGNCSICTHKKVSVDITTKEDESAKCAYPFCGLSFGHLLETCPYYLSVCANCRVPKGHEYEIKKTYMKMATEILRDMIREEINSEIASITLAFQLDTPVPEGGS